MSTRKVFDEAKPAMEAMESLMKRSLSRDDAHPLSEFVGGGYEQAIEYAEVEREKYKAEVGKRDGNYIFHFWPRTSGLLPTFGDKLGDAMLSVFKHPERVSAKHDEVWRCFDGEETAGPDTILCRFWGTPEEFAGPAGGTCPNCGSKIVRVTQSSWAVKVTGYADNPLADELAGSVFDKLDQLL